MRMKFADLTLDELDELYTEIVNEKLRREKKLWYGIWIPSKKAWLKKSLSSINFTSDFTEAFKRRSERTVKGWFSAVWMRKLFPDAEVRQFQVDK